MTLQGSIDSFPFADVLRLLGSTRKTGELLLEGDRGSGRLWVDDGGVVAGETSLVGGGGGAGSLGDVLFDLLRFAAGDFSFDAAGSCPRPSAPVSVETLLAQAELDMAEWRTITAIVPHIDCVLELVDELIESEVVVDRRMWAGIAAIGGGRRVDAMAVRLSLGDLAAMRLAADLVSAGFAQLGSDRPAEIAPSTLEPSPVFVEPALVAPTFDAPAFDTAVFETAVFETAGFDMAKFETAPSPEVASFALDSLSADQFAPVDDADLDALFESHGSPVEPSAADGGDVLRQLSSLSPSAARAIAAASAGGDEAPRPPAHTFGGLSGSV